MLIHNFVLSVFKFFYEMFAELGFYRTGNFKVLNSLAFVFDVGLNFLP